MHYHTYVTDSKTINTCLYAHAYIQYIFIRVHDTEFPVCESHTLTLVSEAPTNKS